MSTTITQPQIKAIVDAYDRLSPDGDATPVTDYSGRGMYGATCLGFTVRDPFTLGVAIGQCTGDDNDQLSEDLVYTFASGARTDSMGLDAIVYWPSITVDDEG